ncbi:hypothetical protein [Clostridium sp. AN503]|uniref:hypothetical protein n=1 Tax=Clostridium sp. AN503 TaxID=3160598 RepID=UPI003458D0D8
MCQRYYSCFSRKKGVNPDRELFLPLESTDAVTVRINNYLRYLYGNDSIPNTKETEQIYLIVENILVDTIINGYSVEAADDSFIDEVYAYYLAERIGYMQIATGIMLSTISRAAKKVVERFWTWSVSNSGSDTEGQSSSQKIPWGDWSDYEHVTKDGQTYAKVGDRLYSRHAVERMQPSGNRYGSNISGFLCSKL